MIYAEVHDPYLAEKRKDILIVRALPVHSKIMGVSGECDVVEFHKSEEGVKLHGHRGLYAIYPVEYKKGRPKYTEEDILQLTAQTMCLEEMYEGALFYGETRRRERILITQELRTEVENMFKEMHQYYQRGYTPKVKYSKVCQSCSLKEICIPKLSRSDEVKKYISQKLAEDEL